MSFSEEGIGPPSGKISSWVLEQESGRARIRTGGLSRPGRVWAAGGDYGEASGAKKNSVIRTRLNAMLKKEVVLINIAVIFTAKNKPPILNEQNVKSENKDKRMGISPEEPAVLKCLLLTIVFS